MLWRYLCVGALKPVLQNCSDMHHTAYETDSKHHNNNNYSEL